MRLIGCGLAIRICTGAADPEAGATLFVQITDGGERIALIKGQNHFYEYYNIKTDDVNNKKIFQIEVSRCKGAGLAGQRMGSPKHGLFGIRRTCSG